MNLNFNLDTIRKKSEILKKFFSVTVLQYVIIGSIKSDYKINDKDEVNRDLYKILNIDLMNEYINKIKASTKDVISITYDSNYDYCNHGEVVKGIIDGNLKKNNIYDQIESIFIPTSTRSLTKGVESNLNNIIVKNKLQIDLNSTSKEQKERVEAFMKSELSFDEVLKTINEAKIDKQIVLNKSLLESIDINQFFTTDFSYLKDDQLLSNIDLFERKTNKVIESLNNNANLKVVSVGGNSANHYSTTKDEWTLHDELNEYFFKLTKGNFQDMKNLSIFMNNLINDKLQNKNQENNEKLIEQFKSNNPEVDINKFISLYIKDFLLHYQNYYLLKNSDKLINNNMNIVEAYDYKSFNDNYLLYKKYNTNIKELDEFFKSVSFLVRNNFAGYNKDQIDQLNDNFDKYKDKYESIFKISKYGCFCNLEFDNSILQMAPHGHYRETQGPSKGTSFASPEYASKVLTNIVNDLDNTTLELYN